MERYRHNHGAIRNTRRGDAGHQFQRFAGFGTQRPNIAGDPQLPSGERSTSRWFDTNAFAEAPRFALGSSSRNPVRGPGYRNLDLAVIKRIAVGTSRALE